ncbi:CHAD domain-containing protein [Bradyrhizobium sp. STM 3562]|uniref:CYTH and CHAD domain-containing protein n=1 Tax=Bradyrhizobium sp. STM 3562 TaxID=578924 RepID=UPI00388D5F1C
MPENDAMALAGEGLRAVTGLQDHASPPASRRQTRKSATSATKQDAAELPVEELTSSEATPAQTPARTEAASDASSPNAAAPRGSEFELKLLVDSDRLADFNDAPVIATNARGKGTRKHLKSAYYDTPERTLWRNGLSLRVRQSGTRFLQTVKAECGDDPLRRGEWEASVPSMTPDLALAMPFIPAKLRADVESDRLKAVFIADIRRHQRIIELPSGTIEVAFDQGVLKTDDRSLTVSEIELELKRGSASAIYEIALRLAEHGPVRPSIRSKAARGFDLADDTPPAARKPQKLRFDPSIPLDDAFATTLRSCLGHLLQSLPAAEDGRDPEGIHQMRVSLRRLRSALHLMRSVGANNKLESLQSEAKWLAQSLSAARDWDIFQSETLPNVAKGCPSIGGFDSLEEVAEKRRSAAYRNVRFVLADRRCAHFLIGLGGWIETRGWRGDIAPEDLGQLAEPAINFARRILSDQYAKVIKRGRRFRSLNAEERHRLRLAVKKLRYVADFLLPLYGRKKATKRFGAKLAELQEQLGSFNDMATTASLLAGLGAERADCGTAAAAIAGWQAHAMAGSEPRLWNAWCDFVKAKPPWLREAEA